MKKFDYIYKRSTTGKIQQWKMELNPDDPSQYRTVSGQTDGKQVESAWKQAKAKNVGRANETSPEEQAILEIESKYTYRLDKEYYRKIEDIDENRRPFKPMLADDWGKRKDKIKYPVYVQPKLDGMRCIVTKDGMFSRNGKAINSCPHIFKSLQQAFVDNPDLILDGELYNHDLKDNFDKIMSLCKKTKPTDDDLAESEKLVQYYIYDIASDSGNYDDRLGKLTMAFVTGGVNKKYCVLTETHRCNVEQTVWDRYANFMEQGYEGAIVRTNNKYENKRSKSLLKMKEWSDSEFTLKRIEEGEGNWAGKAKSAVFELDTDPTVEFRANIKGTREFCEELLHNHDQFLGTKCTVTYMPQRTPAGIPRFPRVKEFARTDNV